MHILYNIGIILYTLGVRIAAIGNVKARLMVKGWRDSWRKLSLLQEDRDKRTTVWFHAASLGEFEQARPVLERYRELHPDHFIALTFFSPSGYEVRKGYDKADMVCYFPMDTPRNARRFVEKLSPDLAYFVKYDFWFNTLRQLKQRNTPTYIFSAIFRPTHYFFKWYGRWFLGQLHCYTHIFVQNDESLQLLTSHGIAQCSVAGDTRFDRVHDIAMLATPCATVEQFIAAGCDGARPRVIMAGSSWEPDERILKQYLEHHAEAFPTQPLRVILAPHVIDETHLQHIETLFGKERCVRFSQWNGQQHRPEADTMIIDNYGLLSSLYRYADIVYIGGGFGRGIHNILEAVTFGKPVCFGPNYHKFQEAVDIIRIGGGRNIDGYETLQPVFDQWLKDDDAYKKASQACTDYVQRNQGSRERIISKTVLAIATLLIMTLTSCSVDKFIKADDKLLYDNDYRIEMADSSEVPEEVTAVLKGLKNYSAQSPNKKFLGVRWGMRVYCLSSPGDTNWLQNYLRRNQQYPVVYNENATLRTAQQLESLMQSKGCFKSTVQYDTTMKGRDVSVTYTLNPSPRYRIDEITYRVPEADILALLNERKADSYLHVGDYYDQDLIAKERDRIVENLQFAGYYRARNELVAFLVDTTYDDRQLSIEIAVNSDITDQPGGSRTIEPLRKYKLKNIYVYPNSSTASSRHELFDTTYYETSFRGNTTKYAFLIPHGNKSKTKGVSPGVISRNLFMFHGQTYHPNNITRTYSSLLNLHNFKYIDIDFVESTATGDTTPTVDARIKLLNSKQQKLSASLEINNSSTFGSQQVENELSSIYNSGNFGLETVLEYQNKNLFGGAELLKVDASLLLELPKIIFSKGSTQFHETFSAFESGLNLSLDIPQFLLPFTRNILWQRMRPHTMFSLGANYQYRTYFERMLGNSSFGYNWNSSRHNQHQLLPIELTFVKFLNKDEAFVSRLESVSDLRLKYQYSDHLIMDSRYDFLYNGQKVNRRSDFNYLHLTLETAGNLLQGLSTLVDGPMDENGIRQIYGVPYAQYVRINADMKRYFYIGARNTFVTRMLVGVGIPYANSVSMPYEKSFFGGGPTTLRAWQLRRLGPGLYSNEENAMAERVGDISLVMNFEDRFPIASIFEGAIFADVGNVWLTHESSEFEGGKLTPSNFLPSLAVGGGLGLRLKISIITIRFDFAIPFYDPGYEVSHRWRPPYWKINQLVTNIGIDYPF